MADFNAATAPALAAGMDLILDGTDNFGVRFLMNELAIRSDTPYIYGAALSGVGTIMPVVPGRTPCLRCIMPEPPASPAPAESPAPPDPDALAGAPDSPAAAAPSDPTPPSSNPTEGSQP